MAAPNLINVTSIVGKTTTVDVTTVLTVLLENQINSNKVYKINSLYISNVSAAQDAKTTVIFSRSTTSISIVTNTLVPTENTLLAISKESSIYLEEGDSLKISGNQNGVLKATISYEIIG